MAWRVMEFCYLGAVYMEFSLAAFTVLRKKYSKPTEPFFKSKFGKLFSIFVTQYLVFFTFIPFVSKRL